jgi:protein-disulfide isomerase
MIRTFLIAGAAALALSACGSAGDNKTAASPVAGKAAPAGSEWTTTVAETPEGGIRMGNPDAPIKLVEYGSFSCPACQAFALQASEPLKSKYIASGKVSLEFRSLLLHATDLMSSLALTCGGPEPFFALMDASYADMQGWMGKMMALPPEEMQRLQSLPVAAQNAEYARITGIDELVVQRGVSREALAQCLADPRKAEALVKQRNEAFEKYNVNGTPTFFINGKMLEGVSGWSTLEPELRAAGA